MKTTRQFDKTSLSVSRREFLKSAGAGLTFAVVLGPAGFTGNSGASREKSAIGAWVTVETDGGILILNPAAEMGQGTMTALPLILAEEMDADWDHVRIEHSPIEPELYGNAGFRGMMLTVGSFSVIGYFTQLRLAGAQIRRLLLDEVAKKWRVPVDELNTEPSLVVHAKTNRRISYGEIVSFAEIPDVLPSVTEKDLKSPSEFRLIGHSVPRRDIPAKTNGTALFSIDVHIPNMVYGMIQRSPVHEDRPASYNRSEVNGLPGVIATVELAYGVGVIAESIEATMTARDALRIEWEKTAQAESFDSRAAQGEYAQIPGSDLVQPRILTEEGDVETALAKATKVYEADYLSDHVYHAQMEPLNAVASVSEDGDSVEIWAGTQGPYTLRTSVADELGIPVENVKLNPCYLGGAFGRRSVADYAVEAVQLSNSVRRPVKLIWTREDDLQYGQFRPMNLQRLSAGIDKNGKLTAWTHCIVGDGGGLLTSGIQIPFYDIANQKIELCSVSHGVRLKHWRAVGHGFNKYAIEAFIDEIARDQDVDPYTFRRGLLSSAPRALKVVDTVAEMANWSSGPPEGHAFGMAFAERSSSLAAAVCEISLDEESGKIYVHRFWAVVDAGIIVQPDNARAQIEGSIVFGLSSVLFESITVKNGMVEQSNFNNYRVLRMSDMPEIVVQFIESNERPTGIGEPGVPIVGGAVANAFLALTGKPLRHMPFSPERVKEIIG